MNCRKWMGRIVWKQTRRGRRGNGPICIGSRGETEVDYGIVNEEGWERVEEFRIGEIVDNLPLEISREKMNQEERGKEGQKKVIIRMTNE
jgi:hypothetical protein